MRPVYYNGELVHYGIKGQRWGVRRFQNPDGTLTAAGKRREIKKLTSETRSRHEKEVQSYVKAKKQAKANIKAERANFKNVRKETFKNRVKINNEYEKEKSRIKNNAPDPAKIKTAVKKYNKTFDAAEKAQHKADSKWTEAQALYKSLGKTKIARIINAARGKSEAAKAYSKAYDSWEKSQNFADKKYSDMKTAYASTGKNLVDRVINNIKYDKEDK